LLNNKLITKTNPSCISTININAIGLDINWIKQLRANVDKK
jgi:hypothetical protein